MKRLILAVMLAVAQVGCTPPPPAPDAGKQGWNDLDRKQFYEQDQGARIMPLAWMLALRQPDGRPFMDDKLARYGYLPNDANLATVLPIGFTTNGDGPQQAVGMTCAACHTREITAGANRYRIDGGPAIVDFQAFLRDVGAAVKAVLDDPAAFDGFARAVLLPPVAPAAQAALHKDVVAWYRRWDTLMTRALPQPGWGPGRLDAVSMIFNRLTGLDIGTGPDGMIPDNIRRADAPVRYPFLWNASRQDKTQWPGFADNGDGILGLARNVGEVYGVFAEFHPFKDSRKILKINYIERNSANFRGLIALERLIEKLEPPKFPWPVDLTLAAEGAAIYGTGPGHEGSCWGCHGITPGAKRLLAPQPTWKTPVMDVGTDSRQYDILATRVRTGVMNGAAVPFLIPALKPEDTAFNVLRTAVVGSILQELFSFVTGPSVPSAAPPVASLETTTLQAPNVSTTQQRVLANTPTAQTLRGAFQTPTPTSIAYEARVMQGIWAAAPYLHNGSVPTLADLLKPAAERPASFVIGPEYDPAKVGLAATQTKFTQVLLTTDCSA
ncbi:MAG: di-heme-cytochrome C peroxidase, partial [Acetobacteraceae bacterium]